jgi:predicted RNA-binding protein with PIN domain
VPVPLLIDGHNLIGSGALPGISLADEDDELQLVRMLRRYRSRIRGAITVFFDSGIPGGRSQSLSGGGVNVVFAPSGRHRADDLISERIRRATNPRSLTLVTADRALVEQARSRGLAVIACSDFAVQLQAPLPDSVRLRPEAPLSAAEVEDWLSFFGDEDND